MYLAMASRSQRCPGHDEKGSPPYSKHIAPHLLEKNAILHGPTVPAARITGLRRLLRKPSESPPTVCLSNFYPTCTPASDLRGKELNASTFYPPSPYPTPAPDLHRDPRPVHQGTMRTYDQSGLANWVVANSLPNHPGPTDRHAPTTTAHQQQHQSRPAVQQSKTTTHDHHHHLESRHGPTATTKSHHSTTTAMPKPRSCLKKGVQFTPSVRAPDERKQEGRNRTKSNGTRVKRMACKYCHVKAVGWTVDDDGYCDGCYRDSRERR